jgi:sigma-B regulation protein RsbU (phosphoserine phosphatase)
MKTPLRALIVEDSEFDARMLVNVLRQGGYDPATRRVETAEEMKAALTGQPWDIILADYNMPSFDAPHALRLLQESGLDIPFLIVSGGIGEDIAVAAMKAGAHDYLMKGSLARLAPAVERELRDAQVRTARRQAERDLRESELRYRQLWETATDAVLLVDRELRIHFANPAVQTVFGYTPAEITGKNLAVLQLGLLTGGKAGTPGGTGHLPKRAVETTGRRADGSEVILEVSFNEMQLQNQQWIVVFVRDITERKRAEAEIQQSQEQFRVAREIQQRLFPKTAPQPPGFDIAGQSHPAEATGGDYFDYLPMQQGRVGLVVADVTGHGVGPALLMAETRAYLRLLALNRDDVGEILTRASRALAEDVDYEHYVTLFLAQLDPAARTVVYASAGHSSAHLLGADGKVKAELKRTGIPLGLKPDTRYESQPPIPLAAGDILVILTDGIEEAMAPDESLFGVERALEVVRANADRSAGAIVEELFAAARDFSEGTPQSDDFTAIVVKVSQPPDGAAGNVVEFNVQAS